MEKTIEQTVRLNLCTSCGICKGICPVSAIEWTKTGGQYLPSVRNENCTKCGLCLSVCPGIGFTWLETQGSVKEKVIGQRIECRNAWSTDPDVRFVSASGGVVTQMVTALLKQGIYDTAFTVQSYAVSGQLKTVPATVDQLEPVRDSSVPKSRYLPVSHEEAAAYIRKNRKARVILIGTACAVRGLIRTVEALKLDRDNYLFIGLFCDKIFTYDVLKHFAAKRYTDGRTLTSLHFKNKESGNWPGNMKLMFEDGTDKYVDKEERVRYKEYFMPERCMYCVDKLNTAADLSVGDNYTDENSSPDGSNSVIIRTENGRKAWKAASGGIESHPVDIQKIWDAQYMDSRVRNLYYADRKEKEAGNAVSLNKGLEPEGSSDSYAWIRRLGLKRIEAGRTCAGDPEKLQKKRKQIESKEHKRMLRMLARIGIR